MKARRKHVAKPVRQELVGLWDRGAPIGQYQLGLLEPAQASMDGCAVELERICDLLDRQRLALSEQASEDEDVLAAEHSAIVSAYFIFHNMK